MLQGQTIVYTARTVQDAHLLRSLLADERIQAVVLSEAMAEGAGTGAVGWATAARVAVADKDARRARQLAVKFDRKQASQPGKVEGIRLPQDTPDVGADWPRCPECDAPRITRCPICGTSGSNFAPADVDFELPEGDEAQDASATCGCGSGTCVHGGLAQTTTDEFTPADADGEPSEPDRTLLLCPTCDEPFRPEYPRRCEWCGHPFDDGSDIELPEDADDELNVRAMVLIVGLAALLVGAAAYFLLVGPSY